MKALVSIILLSLCISCQMRNRPLPAQARVTHVVVCWLKTPGDSTAQQKLIDESHAFIGEIPGLLHVWAGRSLPSDRTTVDKSFDVVIVMTFANEQALRDYERHPRHTEAVEQVLKPLVDRVVVYDAIARSRSKGRTPQGSAP